MLYGRLDVHQGHAKRTEKIPLEELSRQRWDNVLGKVQAKDYDAVLDAAFDEAGTPARRKSLQAACWCYCGQPLTYNFLTALLNFFQLKATIARPVLFGECCV